MNFERGLSPKESMGIGLGPELFLVDLINGSLLSSEPYKDYAYCPEDRMDGTRHSWIKIGGGAYFSLFKNASPGVDGPEEFRNYFITYDTGGLNYGSIPVYDFLISIGVGL